MGLKGKIFKLMSDILKDGSYYKLYTQAKSTLACGLPKGFFSTDFLLHVFALGESPIITSGQLLSTLEHKAFCDIELPFRFVCCIEKRFN